MWALGGMVRIRRMLLCRDPTQTGTGLLGGKRGTCGGNFAHVEVGG